MANVDTSIHDRTTGGAAKLAAAHSSPAPSHTSLDPPTSQYLTLYGSWFCPFVQRVWLVLHAHSIPHRYVEINPYKKEPHFLDLNPRGLVPTLAIQEPSSADQSQPNNAQGATQNGAAHASQQSRTPEGNSNERVLYESSVLLSYLNDIHALALYPPSPYARARTLLWIDHISSRIIPSFYRFLQHTPATKAYTLASAREEFVKHIYTFASELDAQGPWFNPGDLMGMADIMLIPWAMRVFLLDYYKGGSGIPNPKVDQQEAARDGDSDGNGNGNDEQEVWARWHRWFDAVQKQESVQDTMSDRERYIEVYQRYAEDTTNSQVGQATRGGRGLP